MSGPFQVVFICTGNRFRSPLAAELFRSVAVGVPIAVRSFGTLDLGSMTALPEAVEHAGRLGVDLTGHRATCLAGDTLDDPDLVLGFERAHVAAAVVEAGARRERTFTLPELVDLLELDDALPRGAEPLAQARAALVRADARRRESGGTAGYPELADPLGRGSRVAHDTADRIRELTTRLATLLFR
jgi:protein-tyrosine phosphatase